MTFAAMPEDDIYVTPPMTMAPTGPQPSRKAIAAPGQEIQHEVKNTGLPGPAQTGEKLGSRIFQSEHKQQQDHTDFARQMCEFVHTIKLDHTACAEGESAHEVQRDG